MTRVITENINPNLPEEQQITIPAHLVDTSKSSPPNLSAAWEKKTRAEYDQAVKAKKLEIQNL